MVAASVAKKYVWLLTPYSTTFVPNPQPQVWGSPTFWNRISFFAWHKHGANGALHVATQRLRFNWSWRRRPWQALRPTSCLRSFKAGREYLPNCNWTARKTSFKLLPGILSVHWGLWHHHQFVLDGYANTTDHSCSTEWIGFYKRCFKGVCFGILLHTHLGRMGCSNSLPEKCQHFANLLFSRICLYVSCVDVLGGGIYWTRKWCCCPRERPLSCGLVLFVHADFSVVDDGIRIGLYAFWSLLSQSNARWNGTGKSRSYERIPRSDEGFQGMNYENL